MTENTIDQVLVSRGFKKVYSNQYDRDGIERVYVYGSDSLQEWKYLVKEGTTFTSKASGVGGKELDIHLSNFSL
jgi:hypothetical protein